HPEPADHRAVPRRGRAEPPGAAGPAPCRREAREEGLVTARPLRSPARTPGLRVIVGKRAKRPSMAPWLAVSLVTIAAFLALVLARTALDRAAFELAELNAAIAEEKSINQKLRVEIAERRRPGRIHPRAGERRLGLRQ